MTARDYPTICGTNPHTLVTGGEGDISNLCQFSWYEWVYFREHTAAFPHYKEVLGHVLGAACGAGNEMVQWILKANGQVVPCHSVRPFHLGKLTSPSEQSKRQSFNALIERRFGTSIHPPEQLNDDVENLEISSNVRAMMKLSGPSQRLKTLSMQLADC